VPNLPPPSAPAERTAGQLVADALRFYSSRFWPSLTLGVAPALLGLVVGLLDQLAGLVVLATIGGVLLSATYAAASALVGGVSPGRRWLTALAAGVVVWAPFPLLVTAFVLPGLAWLALVGLVVPVVVLERRGVRDAFRRAVALARADYVHALGSLATLAILVFLSQALLFFLLRGQGEQTLRIAAFLASLVVSPLLFLGSVLLYFDQSAREDAAREQPEKRR
jgi:hypothetical protein